MRNKNEREAWNTASDWNAKYPPGTAVDLRRDNGATMRTNTRSLATVSNSGDPVIWLDGVRGYYLLDRCTPVPRTCIGCGGQVQPGETPSCGH